MKTIQNAAIYARVSTTDQDCEMQLRDLRSYCESRGWTAVEYVDTGVSGAKTARQQLDRLMKDAKRRKIDVVICWRFDRFARSTKHLLDALEEFKSLGIGFVSHQEAIDTTSPMGKLLFVIVAAMGEMERSILIERVRAGMANAKAKGKSVGRPKKAFRRDLAVEMRAAGSSWRTISRALGVPVSTVREACAKNEGRAERVLESAARNACKSQPKIVAA
jgi:DNA invertase Pin-like site-specific DNA recombinase